jgi:hypothetical protein
MNRTNALRQLLIVLALLGCSGRPLPAPESRFDPAKGLIPDEVTATRVAEAVWTPFYGEKLVQAEKPFRATLVGDRWTVKGTLPTAGNMAGGTLLLELDKRDGRILRMTHGQ